MSVRIVLGVNDPPTRAGLRLTLEGDFEVSAEAANAAEAVEAVARTRPEVCLLDMNLPGDAVAAAAQIAAQPNAPAVVMLTESPSEDEFMKSLRAGALGYLRKDMRPEGLPRALQALASGEAAIPRGLISRLIDDLHARSRRRASPRLRERGVELTRREWEVLELMERGASTAEVAHALSVSPVTVRRHLSTAIAKLGAPDRDSAVKLFRQERPS
jgi:DNA-binding NarL/FixJ family response regulator